jgi:peptide/nickel transport system ATP-binding protein
MNQPIVICDNLVKIYKIADLEVVALQGLDLEVGQGEMMALVGASGSGKSTLLNVLGGLDTPSAGHVRVGEQDLLKLKERERVHYKRDTVGFVWQQPARNLLPYLSARENVELPMMLSRQNGRKRQQRALELLDMVGLADRANFRPDRLSGGQQQRVALAIALANNPPLLLADEPTGQVDSESAADIFEALRRITATYGTTVIVVTHDVQVAGRVDRVVGIRDGRTSTEIRRERNLSDGSLEEEEWVIMDQAGRLQLPQAYVEQLDLRERVKLRLEPDHVSVWPRVAQALMGEEGNGRVEETTGQFWRPPRLAADEEAAAKREAEGGTAVTVTHLSRTFHIGVEEVQAVRDVSLTIPTGKLVLIKGRSGSGKTTLLNLIAGLDDPTSGDIVIAGRPLSAMTAEEKIELRRRHIGFVFQTFGLLPFLSARENVETPLRLLHTAAAERQRRTGEVLELVGLAKRMNHRAYELSGGEQQRVALARALANHPTLILADEPTGQLDTTTGANIIALFRDIITETGVTVIIASHDPKMENAADLVFELHDGCLVSTPAEG